MLIYFHYLIPYSAELKFVARFSAEYDFGKGAGMADLFVFSGKLAFQGIFTDVVVEHGAIVFLNYYFRADDNGSLWSNFQGEKRRMFCFQNIDIIGSFRC